MSANARDRLRHRRTWLAAPHRSRRRLLAAVGFALALAAPAGAATDVDCNTPDDFCTGNPCEVAESLRVTVTSCVLDFGARDLVIKKKVKVIPSGGVLSLTAESIDVRRNIDGKQNGGDGADISLIATAGDIAVGGKVEASGGLSSGSIVIDASGNVEIVKKVRSRAKKGGALGGTVTIDAGGTITTVKNGRVDVRGRQGSTVGGQVMMTALGGVDLTARIDARGKPGGSVSVSCPSCLITLSELIRVDGWRRAAGGGTVTLSGGDITLTQNKGKIRADGRAPGAGTISLNASGTADVFELRAEGVGVPGGTVAVLAGTVSAQTIVADGSPGGTIELTSTGGDVTLRSGKARSGSSSSGGLIDIDSAANATIESRAIVRGGIAGGEVQVVAAGDITLGTSGSADFDARGAAGGVIEGAAGGDLTADGKYSAETGGCVGLSAGGTLDTTSANSDVPITASCP